MSGARVGWRLQRLSPRLPCGLGIRLAAAARAAVAFARRHCSRVIGHPASRRPLPSLCRPSSASLRTDGALLHSLVWLLCVPLFLLPFAAVATQRPAQRAPSKTHAQAWRSRACSSRPWCRRRRRKINCHCDGPGLLCPGPWVPPPPLPPPLPRRRPPVFRRKRSRVEAGPRGSA